MTAPTDLPERVVVDQHGHYWRDYGMHWSMPPVSDENVATEAIAVYARVDGTFAKRIAAEAVAHDRATTLPHERSHEGSVEG